MLAEDRATATVSWPMRWLAIGELTLAVPLFALIVVILATIPLREPDLLLRDLATLVAVVAFLSALMAASAWMLTRLLRKTVSRNGVTMMPTWFVRVCGVAFSAGSIWLTRAGNTPRLIPAGGAIIGISMILLAGWIQGERLAANGEPDAAAGSR